MQETIVALATAPLKAALAIVRISGPETFNIVSKIWSKGLEGIKNKGIHYGKIVDEGKTIDEVVLLSYVGPHSFTGEDSIEIICHGSTLIANQIIESIIKHGARYALNGEFSSRAFMNKKIDLIQAEAINDLINATTKEAKQISMLSLEGKATKIFEPIKTKIADLLSLIEVNIDYPEYKDIEQANREKIVSSLQDIEKEIDALIKNGSQAQIIKEGIKVAIIGRPNVGKSSLLNALLDEEKAIVTDIAGTTRDIVEGSVSIKGITLNLLDTAGIRNSDNIIETIGIDKSIKTIEKADLVILVIDPLDITNEDEELMNITRGKKRIVVYNKKDKLQSFEKDKIYISALNKDIEPLKNEILKILSISNEAYNQPSLNNTRQIGLLKQIKENIKEVIEEAQNDTPIDILSISLMSSYQAALDILGEGSEVDFTKEIFSRFCLGK